jgi:predicted HTH domain antitoxin
MQLIDVKLKRPISQFVDHQSREHEVSPEETVAELLTLGFDTLLRERYERYQRGEISFGGLAKELGITTWELSHLLEERGWAAHNLPSAA